MRASLALVRRGHAVSIERIISVGKFANDGRLPGAYDHSRLNHGRSEARVLYKNKKMLPKLSREHY